MPCSLTRRRTWLRIGAGLDVEADGRLVQQQQRRAMHACRAISSRRIWPPGVTLELLKRLEGEVLNTLHELGATSKMELEGVMVTPANFYGIELNPRAAAIAEQVLWIGFLQWHLRTHGNLHNLPEPIIKDLHNIQCRDAVLDYDSKTEQRDANGDVVTKWDGRTTKPHPVTGEEVPDPEAREPVYTYSNPKPAKWPAADYIVGNPPFIGYRRGCVLRWAMDTPKHCASAYERT